MSSNEHDWENANLKGFQSIDVYVNKNLDLVIRQKADGYIAQEDAVVVIPQRYIGKVSCLINQMWEEIEQAQAETLGEVPDFQ
jgi:hypothetical protein